MLLKLQGVLSTAQRTITSQEVKLGKVWDQRLVKPTAFVPAGIEVSPQEAILTNELFGIFASSYFLKAIRHLKSKKSCLIAGYGKGYDKNVILSCFRAQRRAVVVDVSQLACNWAFAEFTRIMTQAKDEQHSCDLPLPKVCRSGLRQFFESPEHFSESLSEFGVYYFCRVLGCLSRRDRGFVLSEMGELLSLTRDPDAENQIILINAFKDDNPEVGSKTSALLTKASVLRKIGISAGRNVYIAYSEQTEYFNKVVTAMTIMAAP